MKTLAVTCLVLCSGFALGQTKTSFEVFGGYSHISGDFTGVTADASPGISLNGWNASLDVKSGRWVGVVADFAGYYPRHDYGFGLTPSVQAHTFLFGPQVSFPIKRFELFGHFLFGASHLSGKPVFAMTSPNSFIYAVGGGVDFSLTRLLALRAQFDSLHNNYTTGDNQVQQTVDHRVVRISTGVVFRF